MLVTEYHSDDSGDGIESDSFEGYLYHYAEVEGYITADSSDDAVTHYQTEYIQEEYQYPVQVPYTTVI